MPIDLDRDGTSGLPSEGMHTVVLSKGREEGAQSSGDPCWKYSATVIGETDPDKGKGFLFTLSLGDSSKWFRDAFFDAVGAPTKGMATVEQFNGAKFRASIVHEPYNGQMRAKVKQMLPVSEASSVPPALQDQPVLARTPGELQPKGSQLPTGRQPAKKPF